MSPANRVDHDPRVESAQNYLAGLQRVLASLPFEQLARVIEFLEQAYRDERQVLIIGNGGSAATASHMACDLGKNILAGGATGRRFRILSLTDNVPWMTALANDLGYDQVFAEQLRNLARPGDLVIAITGSGNSPNVVEALRTARELGLRSVALLGFDGGRVKELVDCYVLVDSREYGYIEDVHMILDHVITSHFKAIANPSIPQ